MTLLIAAAATFVLMHLLVSGTRLRGVLVGTVGEGPYLGLYSLGSLAALVWLGFAFAGARGAASNLDVWTATPATKTVQLALQFVAMIFIVVGITTPNPTTVGQQGLLEKRDSITGMLRITRHPFLWGVALWAAGHILVNGDLAGLILFGSMLVLAVAGTTSIDAKRKRALGEAWDAFAAKTSNLPFAAILSRRQSLRIGEIGAWRLIAAVVVYGALIAGHAWAFKVSPLP
jgi:uncharacterized membrane protein